MDAKTTLAASVQAKKGRLYAVIQVKENGKTKPVWRALGLPEGTNKSKVNKAYREVVKDFENDYAEQLARNEKPASDIPIFDYMCAHYRKVEKNIQKSTAESYHGMIYGRIRRYFTARNNLTVGNITSTDIEDFYEWMFESGVVANTVIHYHTVLHSAFKRAFKDGLIDANPFDRIDRPKKNKFTGEHYSEDEMITMFRLFRGDVIYPAVVLAGGLGLRRSEALGARWSRVDWDKRTILLDTKVIEYKEDGKVIVEPIEEMKNKSSRRTLPIPDHVYEMLCEEREKQDLYRRMFKGSYNRKFDDYICVDQLGELLRPNRVTQRFSDLIERYDLRKIRFHDLRHTFASILINQDVPLLNVSAFLGHSDLATTANIYAHLDKSKKQESADIISNIFNKAKE
ncbi:MAG: tyrosine-type recombinase/integrase [Acutalibacteraceae bacterium]|nr:tyrosine-type recombinase/integrase [Acutalibacteraceae bacterium]